jgi:uncharacterized protein
MNTERVIGIYHKDCIDGTTAAAVVLRKFPHAQMYPLQHGHSPEEVEEILQSTQPGAHVYTVDCGLGAKDFLTAGYRVITIDHHMGAKHALEDLAKTEPQYTFVFDNEKSGASLSWSYFFPDEAAPEILRLVEDFDLWKWRYGDETRDVTYYLSMFLNQPDKILPLLEQLPDEVKEKGSMLSQYANALIERYTSSTRPNVAQIGPYSVPAYNIVDFQSECANILSAKDDCAVMLYSVNGNAVRVSFRSKEHHQPTSLELATYLNGGGHKNSAGAHITLKELTRMLDAD